MNSEGMRLNNALKNPSDYLMNKIISHAFFVNTKIMVFTEIKIDQNFVFTITYKIKEEEEQRPNFYALHVVTPDRPMNFEGVLRTISQNIIEKNIKDIDLNVLKDCFERRIPSIQLGEEIIEIDWSSENVGGVSEIW